VYLSRGGVSRNRDHLFFFSVPLSRRLVSPATKHTLWMDAHPPLALPSVCQMANGTGTGTARTLKEVELAAKRSITRAWRLIAGFKFLSVLLSGFCSGWLVGFQPIGCLHQLPGVRSVGDPPPAYLPYRYHCCPVPRTTGGPDVIFYIEFGSRHLETGKSDHAKG